MRYRSFYMLMLFLPSFLFAQADADSIAQPATHFLKKAIFPTSLFLAGSLLSGHKLEHQIRQNVLKRTQGTPQTSIDNYLVFAPAAQMYLADILQVKAKNHWFDQSKNLMMSALLNQLITFSLKYAINKTRPDGTHHSFPSGHTSTAFVTAEVLHLEFKDSHPFLAYSGYGFATTTGALRIINNRHWLSDVLAGAGIGILSAKIIYHFEPLKNWNPFKKKKNMVVFPKFNHQSYAIGMNIIF